MSKRNTDSGGGVNLGLIVTPMLDMSFQLLAFFIMVYSPNADEEFIGADLTRSKASAVSKDDVATIGKKKDKSPPLPGTDRPPELEDQITILLSRHDPRLKGGAPPFDPEAKKGESLRPRYIQIRTPASVLDKGEGKGSTNVIELGEKADTELEKDALADLEKRLQAYFKETHEGEDLKKDAKGKDKEGGVKTKVRIEADPLVQFNYVIQVYAMCRRQNFEDVNFTTPLD
ncbi:MAG: biopolymer transporter ExbD [Gemmataceae bacterium]